MKLFIHSRVVIASIVLLSMLYSQLAVAAYSCPMMAGSSQAAIAMPDCDGMDMEQPMLCHTHAAGEAVQQSQNKSELPQVQAFVPTELILALPIFDSVDPLSITPRDSLLLVRSTSPPVAILHCCFRI